jgi:hypothetical protein
MVPAGGIENCTKRLYFVQGVLLSEVEYLSRSYVNRKPAAVEQELRGSALNDLHSSAAWLDGRV